MHWRSLRKLLCSIHWLTFRVKAWRRRLMSLLERMKLVVTCKSGLRVILLSCVNPRSHGSTRPSSRPNRRHLRHIHRIPNEILLRSGRLVYHQQLLFAHSLLSTQLPRRSNRWKGMPGIFSVLSRAEDLQTFRRAKFYRERRVNSSSQHAKAAGCVSIRRPAECCNIIRTHRFKRFNIYIFRRRQEFAPKSRATGHDIISIRRPKRRISAQSEKSIRIEIRRKPR